MSHKEEPVASRDPFLDNAKFFLMILVVLGHMIEKTPSLFPAALVIYAFHMPAFIFLAGAVSKPRLSKNNFFSLLSAYLIFNFLYVAFDHFVVKKYIPQDNSFAFFGVLYPTWVSWFLLSLIFWRASLFLFTSLRYPVTVSIIIALSAGLYGHLGGILSLMRTGVFLPFFIAGYFHKDILDRIKAFTLEKKAISLIFLTTLLVGIYHLPGISQFYLWGAHGYKYLVGGYTFGPIFRLAHLAIASLCTLTFLALIPQKKSIISDFGSRSMPAFLLHGFITTLLFPFMQRAIETSFSLTLITAAILSFVITTLLSTKMAHTHTTSLIQKGAYLLDKCIPRFKKT